MEDRLRKIFVEHLGVEPDAVTREAGIINDLGADSLDTVELAMAIEEEFGIMISDEEWERVSTFGEALTLIQKGVQ